MELPLCKRPGCTDRVKSNRGMYCSKSCSALSTRNPTKFLTKPPRKCRGCDALIAHSSSRSFCTDECRMTTYTQKSWRPIESLLIKDSPARGGHVKRRLIRIGVLEQKCAWCGITEWRGRVAPLELDHINGDNRDHRLENLRLLCANCHTQTETYCGRNKPRSTTG